MLERPAPPDGGHYGSSPCFLHRPDLGDHLHLSPPAQTGRHTPQPTFPDFRPGRRQVQQDSFLDGRRQVPKILTCVMRARETPPSRASRLVSLSAAIAESSSHPLVPVAAVLSAGRNIRARASR